MFTTRNEAYYESRRLSDEATGFNKIKLFFWNEKKQTIFGRTLTHWGKIITYTVNNHLHRFCKKIITKFLGFTICFYSVFYIVLFAFFFIQLWLAIYLVNEDRR